MTVTLDVSERLVVEIVDNGSGIDPEAPRSGLRRSLSELAMQVEAVVDLPPDPVEALAEAGFDPLLARS